MHSWSQDVCHAVQNNIASITGVLGMLGGGLAPGSIMARSESILAALFGAGGSAVVAGLIGDYAGIRAELAVALVRRGGVPNCWAYGGMCERHCPVPYTAPQAQCQWLR